MKIPYIGNVSLANMSNAPIFSFLIFYFIVCFGGVAGFGFSFAPFLLLTSIWCLQYYRHDGNKVTPWLFKPLVVMGVLMIIFSINYFFFQYVRCPYYQYLPYSLLPYITTFVFYRFASRGEKEYNLILLFFVIFFIIGIFRFYHGRSLIIEEYLFQRNNYFYYILLPIPVLLLIDNKYVKLIILLISFYLCVLSMKRSALLGIGSVTVIFLFKEILLDRKTRIIGLLIIILLAFISSRYFDLETFWDTTERLSDRFGRLGDDGASGRTEMWQDFLKNNAWDGFLLLGQGYQAYYNKTLGNAWYLHNDILEIFYSLGLVGAIAYLSFIYRLGKQSLFHVIDKNKDAMAFIAAFILLILYIFAAGVFSFIDLCLPFFAFIGLSQVKVGFQNRLV